MIRHLQGWQPCFKVVSVGQTFPPESNGANGIASGDRCLDPRVVKPSLQCHEFFLTLSLGVFFAKLKQHNSTFGEFDRDPLNELN